MFLNLRGLQQNILCLVGWIWRFLVARLCSFKLILVSGDTEQVMKRKVLLKKVWSWQELNPEPRGHEPSLKTTWTLARQESLVRTDSSVELLTGGRNSCQCFDGRSSYRGYLRTPFLPTDQSRSVLSAWSEGWSEKRFNMTLNLK